MTLAQATAARVPLRDGSVHCIVTSPPYYQQRKYKVACQWPAVTFRPSPHLDTEWRVAPWYGELGWEPHPLDFVGHLLLCFRECYRVLREDGTLWVNISDKRTNDRQWHSVPEMLLAALVADGWRHEDTVLWRKVNCMPGSQTNRFTRDFEKVYMLNKSTGVFFDIDAVREPHKSESLQRYEYGLHSVYSDAKAYGGNQSHNNNNTDRMGDFINPAGRTRRTTWDITTKGTGLAHYAAFPPDLVTPMLRSSISERGTCPRCSAPWERVVERTTATPGQQPGYNQDCGARNDGDRAGHWIDASSVTLAWRPTCSCYPPPEQGPVRCPKCDGTGREHGPGHICPNDEAGQQARRPREAGVTVDVTSRLHNQYTPVPTGNPCPRCSGTGTVTGDVWPDDVDTWETAPSVVLDPFAGTATVAEALRGLQIAGAYPARFVGLDLNHGYLADLARERLGLRALAAWENGDGKDGGGDALDALPLFAETQGG